MSDRRLLPRFEDVVRVDQPWRAAAACRECPDPEMFFPGVGTTGEQARSRYCAFCVVQLECLAYGMDTRQPAGIWGGASERDRRALRAGRLTVEQLGAILRAAGRRAWTAKDY